MCWAVSNPLSASSRTASAGREELERREDGKHPCGWSRPFQRGQCSETGGGGGCRCLSPGGQRELDALPQARSDLSSHRAEKQALVGARLPPNILAPLHPEGRNKERRKETGSVDFTTLQREEETGSLPLYGFVKESKSPLLSLSHASEAYKGIRICLYRVCLSEKSEEVVH